MGTTASLCRYLLNITARAAGYVGEAIGFPDNCYDLSVFVDETTELRQNASPGFYKGIDRNIHSDKQLIVALGNRVPYKEYDKFREILCIGGSDEQFNASLQEALEAVGAGQTKELQAMNPL